jgi:hypothetical protein
MDKHERVDLLIEAQEKLSQAISLIEEGLKGTPHERHADAYIIGHLRSWIDAYGYDMGIQQYIDRLYEEDEEEDEEDED